jgi:hypothetical protein
MTKEIPVYIRAGRAPGPVHTTTEETDLEGDYCSVPGLIVTCNRCGHSVEVFGQSEASEKAGR